ncbi:polyprenyl synthetase family protein [Corallococcus sp. AB004]|uniref:polyprenyl synthetase family protein n=1 Tax=Corallococcus TaxID=83461 RepID=UPI000EA17BE9|nr:MULTISPECIES: farnesyl diphosphate synthase [Corallococcus]RKI36046.1 polyprenyl synthetase family protein [Corallococcus sp. AB004]NPC74105.1 polyprenyl synthetase family protein [Corallococcus exiguus]NPD26161.1 polyprenyl synthetase family protein [Corallococcus exiguus]NRD48566.1 polyprenyl synthetase family protein [Corallococcus exiguus]RKI01496.1 polyprenyl synthetase family protein [Corallococcus sp. AB038B]
MAAFNLDPFMRTQQSRVEALLLERADRLGPAGTPPRLAESMRYSLLAGGKRLRPVLCLAFADAVSKSSTDAAVVADAACALEYVHTYSLVHDDLPSLDNDDLRRGLPTNHKVYGEPVALLAGDGLLTEAFNVLASGPEPVRGLLCAELARAAGASGMVGGQALDIAADRAAALDYLLRLHRMKTGALILAACRMGVLAAGGDAAALASAVTYGEAVGLAFQIADDVLDVTSSAEAMGKPVGADAEAGRFTFPAVVGLDESRRMADELVARAEAAVRPLEGVDGPLAALARYSVERKS